MTARRTAIYVRISSDPSGERLGVTRQMEACRQKAETLGWSIAGVYEDNDISASGKKPRPAYEQMLADLLAGTINAVVVWDLDRLTRRPIEIENFIDLADRHGIALASVGGDFDLATDNGRMFARIKGAVARAEVERKSARQKAANAQRANAGRPPGGRRAFGYTSDGLSVVEHEAAEVRKAVEAMLAGGTIRGIVADITARSVTTTLGGPWRPTELRRLLANPRYAGQRVHQGEIVGPGIWPAIVDLDEWRALQGVLRNPARHRAGRPERYLLSGVARCATCGGRVYGSKEPRGRTYFCETRRHVVRRADAVEELVVRTVLERLMRPDARQLFARPDQRGEAEELRQQESAVRARLDALTEAFAEGEIDRAQLRAGSERLRARLLEVTAALAALAVTPAVAQLVSSSDVEAAWAALDLPRQRAIIDNLLAVQLQPPGRGARRFDPLTVPMTWK